MARTRTIRPAFFEDEDLANLSPWHRLAFAGLWLYADREGRLKDNPRLLKAQIFPYDPVDINAILEDLAAPKAGGRPAFIARYSINGLNYIQVINFKRHQSPHPTEAASVIPAPSNVEITESSTLANGENPLSNVEPSSTLLVTSYSLLDLDLDQAAAAIFKSFEGNIHLLTPHVSDEMKAMLTEGVPLEWFLDAIKEAVDHNARNWAYIRKILRTWQSKGRGEKAKAGERAPPVSEKTWEDVEKGVA